MDGESFVIMSVVMYTVEKPPVVLYNPYWPTVGAGARQTPLLSL